MMDPDNKRLLCDEVLSCLEIQEYKLLSWGLLNGYLTFDVISDAVEKFFSATEDEELRTLWQQAGEESYSLHDMLENLINRKLVFTSRSKDGRRYRTRFAEAIRNLFLLRQRFSHADWQTASRLVGDLRLSIRRRRYPSRDVDVEAVRHRLAPYAIRQELLHALLSDGKGGFMRLSKFQAEATEAILARLQGQKHSAVFVGAGTGSGKTKAFYLPAMLFIANELATEGVKAIALYPRVELLKDQLKEAYREARKLDHVLVRPIVVAPYFANVPDDAGKLLEHKPNWQESSSHAGWICPFFDCPQCGKPMVWKKQDVSLEEKQNQGHYARLTCTDYGCGCVVDQTTLLLTRQQMRATPPDVLFTTTEMLNRNLSDAIEHRLFGINVPNPPSLVLMDEIHLNDGFHGAQIAYLLRRWQYLRDRRKHPTLCIVGLSATLEDAQAFFSKLSGIPTEDVLVIQPREEDLVQRGMEYNVVVRNDPQAGTTLLSTSVHVAVLMGRVLDLFGEKSASEGACGQRIFAFANTLDVVNRWHHILSSGVENPKEPTSTWYDVPASITDDEKKARYKEGQYWYYFTQIGHKLGNSLKVNVTSSQHRGVDESASFVVATSALEVGYNDPFVGAVIQHRASQNRASLLQRKGRAGRNPTMRPWMVLVASSYGFDRWVFQHAESAFNPILPPLGLPLQNLYVLKIQASYALMDYLAKHVHIDVWKTLTNRGYELQEAYKQALLAHLESILRSPEAFVDFLREALCLQDELALQIVLWGEPRPLMTELIPTLQRQLNTSWQVVSYEPSGWRTQKHQDARGNTPLRGFVPSALFEELNPMEVRVKIPRDKPQKEDEEGLPIGLALGEFAPGRVSKRYTRRNVSDEAHWMPFSPLRGEKETYQRELFELPASFRLATEWQESPEHAPEQGKWEIYSPSTMRLKHVPPKVDDSSYARYVWKSRFLPYDYFSQQYGNNGWRLRLTKPMKVFFSEADFFTHQQGNCVQVTRYAPQFEVSLMYKDGIRIKGVYDFVASQRYPSRVALGFMLHTDALRFRYQPLDVERLKAGETWRATYQSLAQIFCFYLLSKSGEHSQYNLYEVRMAVNSALTSLVKRACLGAKPMTLQEAFEQLTLADVKQELEEAILQQDSETPSEERVDFDFADRVNLSAILPFLRVFWDDTHPRLTEFLQEAYAYSLGQALFTTIGEFLPDAQLSDLHLDVELSKETIWVSELSAGGIGVLQRLTDEFTRFPQRFERIFLKNIHYCRREALAQGLFKVSAQLGEDETLKTLLEQVRQAEDLPSLEKSHEALRASLSGLNIDVDTSFSFAVSSKFLRPDFTAGIDELMVFVTDFWQKEEKRLGIFLQLDVVTKVLAMHPRVVRILKAHMRYLSAEEEKSHMDYEKLLEALLWTRCSSSCPDCIEHFHYYQRYAWLSRQLVQEVWQASIEGVINANEAGWMERLYRHIYSQHEAVVVCSLETMQQTRQALAQLQHETFEIDGILLCRVRVQVLQTTGDRVSLRVALEEVNEEVGEHEV
jgi:hypothetical protein